MDKVYDNLWIGSISDAQTEPLDEYNINAVVTVCQDSVEDNIGCDYYYYNMSDGPDNKYGGDHSYNMYKNATDKLYHLLVDGSCVLIHCHKGRSRSVSVAIGALCRIENINPDSALDLIKENREIADPDDLLLKHSRRYYNDHNKESKR